LKSVLLQALPKFHGMSGEDPHQHLMEFMVVCSTMKPAGVAEDVIRMKAFPFLLQDAAKIWLFSQPAPITEWNGLKRKIFYSE